MQESCHRIHITNDCRFHLVMPREEMSTSLHAPIMPVEDLAIGAVGNTTMDCDGRVSENHRNVEQCEDWQRVLSMSLGVYRS